LYFRGERREWIAILNAIPRNRYLTNVLRGQRVQSGAGSLQYDGRRNAWWRVEMACRRSVEQGFKETLARRLTLNVSSFTTEDDMPVVGRKFHIACYGRFRLAADGSGVIVPVDMPG
jgi:hypothetical protein